MNQKITNLENKITEIQTFINNWKLEIVNYEKTLQALAQQLTQIKLQIQKK